LEYLARVYYTISLYRTAYDFLGLQTGQTEPDILVLELHFHPDHRLENNFTTLTYAHIIRGLYGNADGNP
jgi:hypothetical protein